MKKLPYRKPLLEVIIADVQQAVLAGSSPYGGPLNAPEQYYADY